MTDLTTEARIVPPSLSAGWQFEHLDPRARWGMRLRAFVVALFALGTLDLDLDELVRLQRALDLGDDVRREAVAGDRDHGVQVMGAGAQVAALGRGELGH